jgi:hypothetical protein
LVKFLSIIEGIGIENAFLLSWGYSPVVDHLPSMCKIVGSIRTATKVTNQQTKNHNPNPKQNNKRMDLRI